VFLTPLEMLAKLYSRTRRLFWRNCSSNDWAVM